MKMVPPRCVSHARSGYLKNNTKVFGNFVVKCSLLSGALHCHRDPFQSRQIPPHSWSEQSWRIRPEEFLSWKQGNEKEIRTYGVRLRNTHRRISAREGVKWRRRRPVLRTVRVKSASSFLILSRRLEFVEKMRKMKRWNLYDDIHSRSRCILKLSGEPCRYSPFAVHWQQNVMDFDAQGNERGNA